MVGGREEPSTSWLHDLVRAPGLTSQNRHAGNEADRLKHRTLAALIEGEVFGPGVRPIFVETHSGAGAYHHPAHAAALGAHLAELPPEDPYARILGAFLTDHPDCVPGSPWIALRLAERLRELRFTEFVAEHARRVEAIGKRLAPAVPWSVRQGDFREHLDGLLEGPGPFVLHIDPFAVVPDKKPAPGRMGPNDFATIRDRLADSEWVALVFLGVFGNDVDFEAARRTALPAGQHTWSRCERSPDGGAVVVLTGESLANRVSAAIRAD